MKRPHVRPGGWAFQYHNDFYPDLDDTAMVLMALEKVHGLDTDAARLAKERGLGWLLGMQGEDGGWGSFDADNKRLYLNNIPFADHGALLDPSTEDLTGRCLELLGTLGYHREFEPAQRALHFLRHTQRHDGPWYGPWGEVLSPWGGAVHPQRPEGKVLRVEVVLPPLGAGDLPPRPGMTERPLPLPLRLLDAIGRWAIAVVEALGRFGTFLAQALGVILTPPFKFWAFIDRINYIGYRSLLIILLTGA